jgi:hypothetical protein
MCSKVDGFSAFVAFSIAADLHMNIKLHFSYQGIAAFALNLRFSTRKQQMVFNGIAIFVFAVLTYLMLFFFVSL